MSSYHARSFITSERERGFNQVLTAMKDAHMSLESFLHMWMYSPGRFVEHKKYQAQNERQRILKNWLLAEPNLLKNGELIIPSLQRELDALTTVQQFGLYDPVKTPPESFNLNAVLSTASVVHSKAPMLHSILTKLLQQARAHQLSYSSSQASASDSMQTTRRLYLILSVLCYSRRPYSSNFLASLMDTYLHGAGVKRRVIESLSGLGICHRYETGNNLLNDIAALAKDSIIRLKDDPQIVVVYDNINFKDTVRDGHMGHLATMQALTTSCLVLCDNIPQDTGLLQSMHNPNRYLLSSEDIFESPSLTGLCQVARCPVSRLN